VRQVGNKAEQSEASKRVNTRITKLQAKRERWEVQRWNPKLGNPGVIESQWTIEGVTWARVELEEKAGE
jgi:hypothetical protein